jgi:threonine/homoserine/homoserine lactone efflux protein
VADIARTLLPLALVVGLSPVAIMPGVLLLMTPRPVANGLGYLGAWLVALGAVVTAAVALGRLFEAGQTSDETVGWVKMATGVVFLTLAFVTWVRRPPAGVAKPAPRWMAALDRYTPAESARLGALLATTNPKNLAMAVAAGAEIAVFVDGGGRTAAGVLVFVLVGSVGVATPVVGRTLIGQRADPALRRSKAWLDRNTTLLTVAVLVLLGLLLLVNALPTVT